MTRAEMVLILDRHDLVFTNISLKNVHGTIAADVNEDAALIKIDNNNWDEPKDFDIADEYDIYLDGKTADLKDLYAGMNVKLVLDKDGAVVFIRANSVVEDEDEYDESFVVDLDNDSGNMTFEVSDDTKFDFEDNKDSDFADLNVGDKVEIEADGDIALKIKAERNED